MKKKHEKKNETELHESNEDNNNKLISTESNAGNLLRQSNNNNLSNNKDQKLEPSQTVKQDINEREKLKQENLEDNNKFDYFIMICLTTIIGYLGKYLINLLLNRFLTKVYKNNYDKKLFLYYITFLYVLSIISSLFLLIIYMYFLCWKKRKKGKNISICQICGYIIYTEKKKSNKYPKRNCCTLCCESFQNCWNVTCCNLLSSCNICKCKPHCICSKCEYKIEDYNKKEEVFLYCYKTQRKSFWCNKFFTNETQQKLFPYMLEYFILQLKTIGFEKQYEKYKNKEVHIKTWTTVFISSFILYLYFTISFSRIVYIYNIFCDKDKENKDK